MTVYGPLPENVALSVQVTPPSLLTCRTTLATAAVGTPLPVYAVSDAVLRLNAGVRVPMMPSALDAPSSVVVIVRTPMVMGVLSTTKAVAAVVERVFPAVSTVATLAETVAFCDAWTTYE